MWCHGNQQRLHCCVDMDVVQSGTTQDRNIDQPEDSSKGTSKKLVRRPIGDPKLIRRNHSGIDLEGESLECHTEEHAEKLSS